jgi:hypothetical protein
MPKTRVYKRHEIEGFVFMAADLEGTKTVRCLELRKFGNKPWPTEKQIYEHFNAGSGIYFGAKLSIAGRVAKLDLFTD